MTDKGAFRWRRCTRALTALVILLALAACTHKVQVEAPKEPIVINLNVKIEQEVRVKVEKDVEDLLADNPELF
jgi:lipoprotein NlpI